MASLNTARVGLGIGAIMAALGLFVGGRALVPGMSPVTGNTWLDLMFGFFFVVRGALQYQRWRQVRRRAGA